MCERREPVAGARCGTRAGDSRRISLGATRVRLVRQLFTESAVLAIVAGVLGILAAIQLVPMMRGIVGLAGPCTAVAWTGRFSWPPPLSPGSPAAVRARAGDFTPPGSRPSAGRARRSPPVPSLRLRNVLLSIQLGVSVVFLLSAGLFVRAVQHAYTLDLGFAVDDVAAVALELPAGAYDLPREGAFLNQVAVQVQRSGSLVGLASWEPMEGSQGTTVVRLPGQSADEAVEVRTIGVSAGYFDVLRIPIVAGRNFLTNEKLPAVLVNEAFARRFWPGEQAMGKVFYSRYRIRSSVKSSASSRTRTPRRSPPSSPCSTRYSTVRSIPSSSYKRTIAAAIGEIGHVAAGLEPRVRLQVTPLSANFEGELASSRRTAAAAGLLGMPRPGARLGRDVRRLRLCRRAAHARNRHPNGARRRFGRRGEARDDGTRPAGTLSASPWAWAARLAWCNCSAICCSASAPSIRSRLPASLDY